jgi:hypothetical protein
MSREEDAIRATTRAIAATVREVPPLRLEPAPGELDSPGRGPRRAWGGGGILRTRSWLAPVAAAAVVVAVAITLVLIRGNPNGSVVPRPAPVTAVPGGVPRYYVAVDPVTETRGSLNGSLNGLLVGDTFTGETLADITPPAHMSYASVTAAADDRTFLAFATESGGSLLAGRWYRLVLAPGTAHVVSLTSTPIGPQSGVVASALSGSGQELAVAEKGPAKGEQRVIVFSVTTGRALRSWSTTGAPAMWSEEISQDNLLTWINGDKAIAFSALQVTTGPESVRRLSLSGPPGDGDLIADSQLIWSAPAGAPAPDCRLDMPLVSADGQAVACGNLDVSHRPTGPFAFTWHVYRASAQDPAAAKYTTAYQFTQQEPGGLEFSLDALWVSPSGSAVIGDWAITPLHPATVSPRTSGSSASATLRLGSVFPSPVHIGVMSHGTFTPLRLPLGILSLHPQAIAW